MGCGVDYFLLQPLKTQLLLPYRGNIRIIRGASEPLKLQVLLPYRGQYRDYQGVLKQIAVEGLGPRTTTGSDPLRQ